MPRLRLPLAAGLLLIAPGAWARQGPAGPIRFKITLAKEASAHAVSGRLLLFFRGPNADPAAKPQALGSGFVPGEVWVAGGEVERIAPGQTLTFNPDLKAYPQPFSQAKPGSYFVMALLDVDHSYAYNGPGPGDIRSPVATLAKLNPASSPPIALTLSRVAPPRPAPVDTENIKFVEFQSAKLSAFWGRPIMMRAQVALPPAYIKEPGRRFATVYNVHGFGGNHLGRNLSLVSQMDQGQRAQMVHVFLDASFPSGHHVFAGSVNNGPWGSALTQEFIPFLEAKFRLAAQPWARFLTGHSSGGWSTLWLQVTYPEFFGGVWSTSPDPVDLRSFTGIDATPGSTDNAYRDRQGRPKNLVRMRGRNLASIEQFAKQEVVVGEYGGQFASFEWVWSPRGQDGRPMKLFDRETGELDPFILKAWQRYDIRRILEDNWSALGPKLAGKIHVICGEEDTFHLEEGVHYLAAFFRRVKADAVCELVPGRDHGDLYQPYSTYPDGLAKRIDDEMWASFTRHGGK